MGWGGVNHTGHLKPWQLQLSPRTVVKHISSSYWWANSSDNFCLILAELQNSSPALLYLSFSLLKLWALFCLYFPTFFCIRHNGRERELTFVLPKCLCSIQAQWKYHKLCQTFTVQHSWTIWEAQCLQDISCAVVSWPLRGERVKCCVL